MKEPRRGGSTKKRKDGIRGEDGGGEVDRRRVTPPERRGMSKKGMVG